MENKKTDNKRSKKNFLHKPIKIIWIVLGVLVAVPSIILGVLWYIDSAKKIIESPNLGTVISSLKKFNSAEISKNTLTIDCSNLLDQWQPGEHIYFDEENKIRLKEGEVAGAIFLKNKVSSFLTFEMEFKSSLETGINTNISFKNNDGDLKYAIGDGDYRTIRSTYKTKEQEIKKERTILPVEIDNGHNIGFKINIIERGGSNKAVSSLVYQDVNGNNTTADLEDMVIPNPDKIFLSIGFGLDARKEPENKDAYIEMVSCNIVEAHPSKVLDQ